jgi:hypothetical protein
VQADTTVSFTVTVGTLSITKPLTLPGVGASTGTAVTPPVVTSPAANSIAFVSASPTSISLKGAGGAGRTETSIVSFIIRDVTGQALAGQPVDFTLDTSVGGLSLIPASAVSDSTGTVKTIVNAGVVSTPVRVTANVRGTSISVKSDQLTVSTGLPHQDGLSLGVATCRPEAWKYDGVIVQVTTMLSDHFGNPVPDGTAVYFTTYGGSIEPSAVTKNGIATVNWRSQLPRPADGIANIMAYAVGEESFIDLNGNGLADTGEFKDTPEAFLAISGTTDITRTYCDPSLNNYNPQLDSTNCLVRNPLLDPFIDFNSDGVFNTGDGKFNGILQGVASTGSPRSLHVFRNATITMSGSDAYISALGPLTVLDGTGGFAIGGPKTTTEVLISIVDVNGNIMPEDTTTDFSFAGTCLKATPSSDKFRSTAAGTWIKNDCTSSGTDTLYVTVTTPKGNITRGSLHISY